MTSKLVVCETDKIKSSGELEALVSFLQLELVKLDCSQGFAELQAYFTSFDPEGTRLILIPSDFEANAEFLTMLKSALVGDFCVWVGDAPAGSDSNVIFSRISATDLAYTPMLNFLCSTFDPKRPVGVKSFLKEGSTIYTQSFTKIQGMGTLLDPCNTLAHDTLSKSGSVRFWSTLNALVAEGVAQLPEGAHDGSRVELQVGYDDEKLCASVRFPVEKFDKSSLYGRLQYQSDAVVSPWLIAHETANFTEVRAYSENNSVELTALFSRKEIAQAAKRPIVVRHIASIPMDDPAKTAHYKFQGFSSMQKKKVKATGFKNSFSEQLAAPKPAPDPKAAPAPDTPAPPAAAAAPSAPVAAPAAPATPGLETKLDYLQESIKQKEELIAKLNKQIEDTKDPNKFGVVSGVIDNQKEALLQKVKRLETVLAETEAREKELMGMVDKAIQQKEKYMKEVKVLETKLEQASTGNNSQVVRLQKQLEEANKQRAALSKKITEMGIGKKAS